MRKWWFEILGIKASTKSSICSDIEDDAHDESSNTNSAASNATSSSVDFNPSNAILIITSIESII